MIGWWRGRRLLLLLLSGFLGIAGLRWRTDGRPRDRCGAVAGGGDPRGGSGVRKRLREGPELRASEGCGTGAWPNGARGPVLYRET